MIRVEIVRAFESENATMGALKIHDVEHRPIYTLENAWVDNTPHVSCIPDTVYIVEPYQSKKHGSTYIVTDVPDRSGILFHAGNVHDDTEGCILLGMMAGSVQGEPSVFQSRKAMDYFRDLIKNETFILTVR